MARFSNRACCPRRLDLVWATRWRGSRTAPAALDDRPLGGRRDGAVLEPRLLPSATGPCVGGEMARVSNRACCPRRQAFGWAARWRGSRTAPAALDDWPPLVRLVLPSLA